jgi:mRNA-degrading endonuclease YafQ of YafQ-DinJ toxin-antitoxin module
MVLKKLDILKKDPFYPSLRTKRMRGGSSNYESSVNMDIRLIWEFEDDKIILMLDVGHHDVLSKY